MYKRGRYTELVCLECGNIFPIYRISGREKKTGHIKHLYCPICFKETAHYEVRDADIFLRNYEDDEKISDDIKLVVNLLSERKKRLVRKRY